MRPGVIAGLSDLTARPDRPALTKIAEGLWTVLQELNRDDVHGVRSLAVSGPDTAYGHTTRALRGVLVHLVDGDLTRADDVLAHLFENCESVAYNLDRDRAERAGHHTCKHCGATIALEVSYGWVDQLDGDDGGTYDACQGDESHTGEHEPDCNGACGLHAA